MESYLFSQPLLERLIFFKQRSYDYLDLPSSLSELLKPMIPSVIVVTSGTENWVFKVRFNKETNNMQFYGKTLRRFLEIKEVTPGHILQLVIGLGKVYLTDFNELGLSKHYYYNEPIGCCRPRCLVYATQHSTSHQLIPINFWNNVKFNMKKSVTVFTHDKDYEVDLWLDDEGVIKGFVGNNWHQLYADQMIFKSCVLIFQHWIQSDYFQLTVYAPDGMIYGDEYVDHHEITNHPHILFDNQLDVTKIFNNLHAGDSSLSHPYKKPKQFSFEKKMDTKLLSRRALGICRKRRLQLKRKVFISVEGVGTESLNKAATKENESVCLKKHGNHRYISSQTS